MRESAIKDIKIVLPTMENTSKNIPRAREVESNAPAPLPVPVPVLVIPEVNIIVEPDSDSTPVAPPPAYHGRRRNTALGGAADEELQKELRNIVMRNPVFTNITATDDLVSALVAVMKLKIISSGDTWMSSEVARELVLIVRGSMRVGKSDEECMFMEMSPGMVFGNIPNYYSTAALLDIPDGVAHKYTATARTIVAVLTQQDFESVMEDFPLVDKQIRKRSDGDNFLGVGGGGGPTFRRPSIQIMHALHVSTHPPAENGGLSADKHLKLPSPVGDSVYPVGYERVDRTRRASKLIEAEIAQVIADNEKKNKSANPSAASSMVDLKKGRNSHGSVGSFNIEVPTAKTKGDVSASVMSLILALDERKVPSNAGSFVVAESEDEADQPTEDNNDDMLISAGVSAEMLAEEDDDEEDAPANKIQDIHGSSRTAGGVDFFKAAFGGPRRASMAVWADEKLKQMANNIARKEELAQKSYTAQSSRFQAAQVAPAEESVESLQEGEEDGAVGYYDEEDDAKIGFFHIQIMAMILSYLPIGELFRLRQLCNDIKDVIESEEAGLLRNVDLVYNCRAVNDRNIRGIAEIIGPRVHTLSLKNCYAVSDIGLREIAKHCRGLVSLNLTGCWEVTDASLVELIDCSHLEKIDLSNCRKITDVSVTQLVANCPRLRNVCFSYCKNLTDNVFNTSIIKQWARMDSINLHRCTTITDGGFAHWQGTIFARMRELVLADCSFITDDAIGIIVQMCPTLHALSLSFCCALTERAIDHIAHSAFHLRALDIGFCGQAATDDSILEICRGMPLLTRLSVRGCIQISDIGAQYLIDSVSSHLKPVPELLDDDEQAELEDEVLKKTSLTAVNVSQCKHVSKEMLASLKLWFTLLTTENLIDYVAPSPGGKSVGAAAQQDAWKGSAKHKRNLTI